MPQITQCIIESLSELHDECKNCLKIVNKLNFTNNSNQVSLLYFKEGLVHCMQQIYTHQKITETNLTSVNFYQEINFYFKNKKKKKRVEYYIQQIDGESLEFVNDENILNNDFTIDNCLPIMRLVPMQLANNARKYMPTETALRVELRKTPKRNHIRFENYGPHCPIDEVKSIASEGVRGSNSVGVAGMGIGLSEVDEIIELHKEWLNTTYDLESSNSITMLNSRPHSIFTIEISYSTLNTEEKHKCSFDKLESKLPLLLIHNTIDITSNMLEECRKILGSNEKNNSSWRESVYILRTKVNMVQDVLKLCMFEYNEKSVNNLLGNTCTVNLELAFNISLTNLCKYYYNNIKLEITGNLQVVEVSGAIYSFVNGISSLILKSISSDAIIEVIYDIDEVIFECNKSFNLPITSDSNLEEDYSYNTEHRLVMYKSMIDAWGGRINITPNRIEIQFFKKNCTIK